MIKINNTGGINSTSKLTKKGKISGGGDFGSILESALADEASDVHDSMPVQGANPFLAIQQVSDEESRQQKQIKYGNDLLNGLERIREQLLIGEVSIHELKKMEKQLNNQNNSAFMEPRLKDIINQIETRVAVEIAKLEAMI